MAEFCENQRIEAKKELAGLVTKAIEGNVKASNTIVDNFKIVTKSDQDLRPFNNDTIIAAAQFSKKEGHHITPSRKRISNDRDAEDWASNVEQAIASIIFKTEKTEPSDEKRRRKKRRRRDHGRKRKSPTLNNNGSVQIDPTLPRYPKIPAKDDMQCIRGGSPKPVPPSYPIAHDISRYGQFDERPYESTSSEYDSDYHNNRGKCDRKQGNRKRANRRAKRNRAVLQDSNSICLFYMQGKCQKGEECQYSHAANPKMKLEVCKFYLIECCTKQDTCLYMHSEFPCKYYHTGRRCFLGERCKFAHGAPLSDHLRQVLLKPVKKISNEIITPKDVEPLVDPEPVISETKFYLEQDINKSENC